MCDCMCPTKEKVLSVFINTGQKVLSFCTICFSLLECQFLGLKLWNCHHNVGLNIFCFLLGAQKSQLNGPQNTLSVVGSNVTLKCSSPSRNCRDTEWHKYGGNPSTVFIDSGNISTAYRDRYSVDNSSGCDLVINNVQMTDAGRFICRTYVSSNTVDVTAYLIIMSKLFIF